jgi:UDP-glucose 4-epimerase
MRIVVTGGAGFIGSHVCRELSERSRVTQVVALDDFSTGDPANLEGAGVRIVHGSILDRDLLDRTLETADTVVHLAARPSVPRSIADPVASHQVNATGTVRVLEACRRNAVHVIAVSSSSVYGSVRELPKHEDLPTRPLSPYAASKLATESYSLAYAAAFGLPVLVLRFFNVYGPFQTAGHAYAAVIPAFIDAALRGRPLRIHGDGHQTRDFTYVGTVAQLLADAALRRVTHDTPVNLAFGTRVSILDVVKLLSDIVGRPLPTRHEPSRAGDVRDSQADDRRLRALFPGLCPVSLETGLEDTVRWFRTLPEYH